MYSRFLWFVSIFENSINILLNRRVVLNSIIREELWLCLCNGCKFALENPGSVSNYKTVGYLDLRGGSCVLTTCNSRPNKEQRGPFGFFNIFLGSSIPPLYNLSVIFTYNHNRKALWNEHPTNVLFGYNLNFSCTRLFTKLWL